MIFDRYIYISWKYEKCQIYYQPPAKSLQMSQALKTIYLGRPQVDTGFLIIQLQPAMFTWFLPCEKPGFRNFICTKNLDSVDLYDFQ